jgi:hypothetical protein
MMDQKTFSKILENRLKQIKSVLGEKAGEYAQRGDRLHNFKVAARANQMSPEQALWGMATKHLVSVMDLVNGDLCAKPAVVNEKIGDMINYLILLEAIFKEDIAE